MNYPDKITMEFTAEGSTVKVHSGDKVIAEVVHEQRSRGTSRLTSPGFFEQLGDCEFAETLDDELSFTPLALCGILHEAKSDYR